VQLVWLSVPSGRGRPYSGASLPLLILYVMRTACAFCRRLRNTALMRRSCRSRSQGNCQDTLRTASSSDGIIMTMKRAEESAEIAIVKPARHNIFRLDGLRGIGNKRFVMAKDRQSLPQMFGLAASLVLPSIKPAQGASLPFPTPVAI